jgi:hypothetical protein
MQFDGWCILPGTGAESPCRLRFSDARLEAVLFHGEDAATLKTQ